MQVWKRVFQVSCQARNSQSLVNLNELYSTPVTFTQLAAYRCTRTLLMPRDTVSKSVERLRKNPLTSNELTKTFISGSKQHKAGSPQNDTSHPKKTKTPSREQAPPSERRSVREKRVSSELQKLRFDDFSESEPEKLFKGVHKDRRPYTKTSEEELEIVFGGAPCLLALTQGRRRLVRLFVKDSEGPQREVMQRVCQEALRRQVQIQRVSKITLDKMCGGKVHQGMCLQASSLGFVTEERSITSQEGRHHRPLWLVLDGVQDPMNLGAILRSAYFLGVDRVASSIHNSCPLTPTVSKASAGVMEVMKVFGYRSLEDMIKVKLEQGWQVVGTVGLVQGNPKITVMSCSDLKMSKPTLLLMGGEGDGLSPELRQLCDVLVTIPPRRDLHPGVESLNVSVATGILLHSLLSTRTGS